MGKKTPRVYTLDELKEKCQQALANPILVEIVKIASLNKDGKVNLSWVYKEAEEYVHGETKDLQKTKELAVEARFLGKIRQISQEEFEKLIIKKEQLIEKPEKIIIHLEKVEFELPISSQITFTLPDGQCNKIKFASSSGIGEFKLYHNVERFCIEILQALAKTEAFSKEYEELYGKSAYENLRDCFIQLLEEKFGLKVKVCGNCKYVQYQQYKNEGLVGCKLVEVNNGKGVPERTKGLFCECVNNDAWAPKEVPEKSSSA